MSSRAATRDPEKRFLDSRWSLPRTTMRGGNDKIICAYRRVNLPAPLLVKEGVDSIRIIPRHYPR